jgi:hypothetical protein
MGLRTGGWEAPWITKSARWVRNIFYIVMFSLLGIYYFIKNIMQIKFEWLHFMIVFSALFGGGLVITSIIEKKVKRATRQKRAEEYIGAHPELDGEKRDALINGIVAGGMNSEEREIASGLIQYDNPVADDKAD